MSATLSRQDFQKAYGLLDDSWKSIAIGNFTEEQQWEMSIAVRPSLAPSLQLTSDLSFLFLLSRSVKEQPFYLIVQRCCESPGEQQPLICPRWSKPTSSRRTKLWTILPTRLARSQGSYPIKVSFTRYIRRAISTSGVSLQGREWRICSCAFWIESRKRRSKTSYVVSFPSPSPFSCSSLRLFSG